MKSNVKSVAIACAFVLLCFVLVIVTVTLIEERSRDIVRVTVTSEELLPTVRQLQGATGKVAKAYPLDHINEDEAKYWRIEIK
jgi:CHASE3 domain sensor protein